VRWHGVSDQVQLTAGEFVSYAVLQALRSLAY
jgi:hypothetical protein